jgi:hypothetical protein
MSASIHGAGKGLAVLAAAGATVTLEGALVVVMPA